MVRVLLAAVLGVGASIALVVAGALPASACSCAVAANASTPQEAQAAFDTADVVFTGRLVDRDEPWPGLGGRSSADPATLTFAVGTVYKGSAAARQEVRTAASGASCGLEIAGEGPFLVFATGTGARLTSSLCSGTTPVVSLATWPGSPPAAAPPTTLTDRVADVAGGSTGLAVAALVAAAAAGGVVLVLRRRAGRRNGAGTSRE